MGRFEETPGWHDGINELKAEMLTRVTDKVTETAQRAAPVDTGHLHDSIHAIVDAENDIGYIAADADYALWVEEGHRVAWRNTEGEIVHNGNVVPPEPFLRPALYSATEDDL